MPTGPEEGHAVRIPLVSTIVLVALSGCMGEDSEALASRADAQFFANSMRRDASASEAKKVAWLGGCTTFFVENNQGKTYLVTARHCVDHAITTWCSRHGRIVDNQGREGECTRVIAADREHDIALYEAQLPYVPARSSTFRLAAYTPGVETRLRMIGYPADDDPETARRGRLTTTYNCWVLSDTVSSPWDDMVDPSLLHNCTTYGGNSGGPMYVEGTRDAIGLPFTYVPDDYHRRDPWDLDAAAVLAQMSGFVAQFRPQLEAAGVAIAESR
jgi:V8-like Glu-specific endopeptidase